ncbi:MAG: 2-oxo acid dehydrogenase subunit E2 [Chloroflexi bacterium]|nr:2-oxo acid dehydrogenase subunit E2 [Chloroflexota bacterium]
MPTKILVPELGEGVEEVNIVNWLKFEGDPVSEFEGLVEVETDKVVTEISSPVKGTLLKVLFPDAGTIVEVDTILAWIGEPGESVPLADDLPGVEISTLPSRHEVPQANSVDDNGSAVLRASGRDPVLGFISPLVAKLSTKHHIDLNLVQGTGRDGRITKQDILLFIDKNVRTESDGFSTLKATNAKQDTVVSHSTVRRKIAEHMVRSRRTSPHVTTVIEVDLSRVIAHRAANKLVFADDDVKLTFTPYFVIAAVSALKAYPLANSSWTDEGIVLHAEINIGMATSLGDDGLIVPVINNADQLALLNMAKTVNDLANRARLKKLNSDEVKGGTFTITNHGVSGSVFAMPIINQPQCAILGVGAIQKRVVVVTDEYGSDVIAIRPMLYLTLTFDHRILDGAMADNFLGAMVESLEEW